MATPHLLDVSRSRDPELVALRGAYETAPNAKTAIELVRGAGFTPDKAHYLFLKKVVKANARRMGLKLETSRYTKPSPRMAFGIAEFRFSIPKFTKKDVVENPKRLGPTWFLTGDSRLAWKILIPTTDAFLRGYENPIVKREYSGGAFGVTGSMRLEAFRRKVFRYFDRARSKKDWMKLIFDKRANPAYIGAVEKALKKDNAGV